jgi:hypothetical protein
MMLHNTTDMQKHLGGIVGLVLALVLETVLFISRANLASTSGLGTKYAALLDPVKHAKQQEPPTPIAGQAFQSVPGKPQIQIEADLPRARPTHAREIASETRKNR